MTEIDQWTWYRAALAAKTAGKPLPPVSDGRLKSGFFWAKAGRSGGRVPVAIWRDVAIWVRWGAKGLATHLTVDVAADRWTWIADNPVSRDDYKIAWDTGKWPDGTPTTAPDARYCDHRKNQVAWRRCQPAQPS